MEQVFQYIKGDRAIWMVMLVLAVASLLLVYSSIVTLAYLHHDGNTFYYLVRHGLFIILGLGIIYMIHKVKYTYFSRIAQIALYASIPLLLLTLFGGSSINEARRWLHIPIINMTFQTSDLAKLALLMYIARMLAIKQEEIGDFKKTVLPIVIPIGLVCGLILPADLSTAALLFVSCLVLMFIGGVKVKHLLSLIGMGLVTIMLIYSLGKAFPGSVDRLDTWVSRIESFFNPDDVDPRTVYQAEQAKIAVATGGITGKLPGKSTQRNFLPHPYSDFIFAIVLEEYGLIGGFGMLLLYLILLYRAIRIVMECPKTFGGFLVIGIAFGLVLQALINMGVAVNLLPVTGQPLPMVSMGGTSMWFTCIAVGIILSVSRGVDKEKKKNNKSDYALS